MVRAHSRRSPGHRLTAAIAAACLGAPALTGQNLVQSTVATQLDSPVAMAVAPDGRVFITQQGGAVRLLRDDLLLPVPFVVVPAFANDEEGLTGIALDPAFTTNGFVYLRYTTLQPNRHNHIVRYTAQGDVAVPGSETVIFSLDPNQAHFHLGSAMAFGADGTLFFGTGDNNTPFFAGNLNSLHGKLLRIHPDGTIPTDNPFFTQLTGSRRSIYALGFRNAFGLAVEPGSGTIFVNDVGAASWEEIDLIQPGGDYGWPTSEGPGNSAPRIDPLHAYPHNGSGQSGCAITGGSFYATSSPQLPAQFVGHYLFTEYCRNEIRAIDPAQPQNAVIVALTLEPGPVDVAVAPDGAVYYLTRGNSSSSGGTGMPTGQLVKITAAGTSPATLTTYGDGCAGANGIPFISASHPPRLGNPTFELLVGNVLPGTTVLLVLGWNDLTSPLGPLPANLGPSGMPGCELQNSADVLITGAANGELAAFPLSLPATPTLLGVILFAQGFPSDIGANPLGFSASMGARIRLGL